MRFLVSLGTSSAIPRILPGKYGGRELEGGGIHPHLIPLPSRERRLFRDCHAFDSQ